MTALSNSCRPGATITSLRLVYMPFIPPVATNTTLFSQKLCEVYSLTRSSNHSPFAADPVCNCLCFAYSLQGQLLYWTIRSIYITAPRVCFRLCPLTWDRCF
ncbi:unnamed protein product [Laminaria digitata]